MNILITGHDGLVGRSFSSYLKVSISNINIYTFPAKLNIKNYQIISSFIKGLPPLDYIYHFADVNGNGRWLSKNTYSQFNSNSMISNILIDLVIKHQVQAKFICVGSVWSYSSGIPIAKEKDFGIVDLSTPLEPYAKSKLFVYDSLRFAKIQYGLNFTYFPTCTVYGPGDSSDHLIPSMISKVKSNPDTLNLLSDGNEFRTYIYVDDLAHAIFKFRDCNLDLVNITTNDRLSVLETVKIIAQKLNYVNPIIPGENKGQTTPELSTVLSENLLNWPSAFNLVKFNDRVQFII